MKKYLVETFYTCTFKTIHTLSNLDDAELAKINDRTDGEVEVIDVKLNNRKTKKVGGKKDIKINKLEEVIPDNISNKSKSQNNKIEEKPLNLKLNNNSRFKMPDRRKGYIQKHKLEIIKFIFTQVSMMTVKLEKFSSIQIKKGNL